MSLRNRSAAKHKGPTAEPEPKAPVASWTLNVSLRPSAYRRLWASRSLRVPIRACRARCHPIATREAEVPIRGFFRRALLASPKPLRRSSITYQTPKALTWPRNRSSSRPDCLVRGQPRFAHAGTRRSALRTASLTPFHEGGQPMQDSTRSSAADRERASVRGSGVAATGRRRRRWSAEEKARVARESLRPRAGAPCERSPARACTRPVTRPRGPHRTHASPRASGTPPAARQ